MSSGNGIGRTTNARSQQASGSSSAASFASVDPAQALEVALTRLRRGYQADRYPALATRRAWLSGLRRLLLRLRQPLTEAVSADFGHRSPVESLLGEVWLTLEQIDYASHHVAKWMRPARERTPFWMLPARSYTWAQPRGVVGIIAPWNYPLMLALSPLAGVLAAGNRALIKLSEHTPRTSALLAEALSEAFDGDVVQVVRGGREMGQAVAAAPLDLLLFTGSTKAGREVARTAAGNLVPVVLELGGKCPAILTDDYPVRHFADRIIQGKCFNAGQSCVAPDYLLVPRQRRTEVVRALSESFARSFPRMVDNPDYTAVAGTARKQRLLSLAEGARELGAQVIELNPANERFEGSPKLPLHLLLDVPADCGVMSEELFGPLLPIVEYGLLDEAIEHVNQRPEPLAAYLFSHSRRDVARVLRQLTCGGLTINDTLLHFISSPLPRTPIGASGQGAYHGRQSFETFSARKAVVHQARWSAVSALSPPYGAKAREFLRWVLR